jgi:hypothetical protein
MEVNTMKHAYRFKLLAFAALAAFAVMGIAAGSAQAGNWQIEGASIASEKTVESEEDTKFDLLIPSFNFEVVCNAFKVGEGTILPAGGSLARLSFSQCESFQLSPLIRLGACDPVNGEFSFLVKDTLILHNNRTYDLFSPDVQAGEEKPLGTIQLGEECAVGPIPIKGSFVMEDCNEPLENEAVRHLLQQAPAALFPNDVMRFGAREARLDGSMWLKLGGAEAGKKFSGHA